MTEQYYQCSKTTIFAIKSDAARYAWTGYYLLILISSLVGGTTILMASLKYRAFNLHTLIVVTIQHIALCDLMVTVTDVVPKFVSLVRDEWVFGKCLCYLTTYATYYLTPASALLICNMTTSKLLLLKYPLQFRSFSVKKAHISCVTYWLAALIVPVATILVHAMDGENIDFSYLAYRCNYGFTSNTWDWLRPSLAVIFLLAPNCLVIVTAVYLLIIANQFARRGRESLRWQGIMTTVLTATVYCISVLPYIVYIVGEGVLTVDDQFFPYLVSQNCRLIPLSEHNQ